MEEEQGVHSSTGRRRRCGYQYMMPSYVALDEKHPPDSYQAVSDALIENSSAHGLPTFYRARGLRLFCRTFLKILTTQYV